MHNIQNIKLGTSLLLVIAVLSLIGLGQFVRPTTVSAAGAVCVILGQGETACPDEKDSTDNKTKFPTDAKACYFYDPGNPMAGTVKNFPGWQKIKCDADIFKEGLCVNEKAKQNPQCKRIGVANDPALDCPEKNCNLTTKYVEPLINVLAAIVGVVVTISIIAGGIQYATSADDPQKVSQAKSRITNALIALVSFFFLYMFLQWLIPGGLLK